VRRPRGLAHGLEHVVNLNSAAEERQKSAEQAIGKPMQQTVSAGVKVPVLVASSDMESTIAQTADYVSAESGWLVVNTKPHRERIAIDNLLRQEFMVYCPMIRKRVSHARRMHDVLRPLFPGYLFVQMDPRWRPILSTVGVRTLVHFGERLSMVANEFIDSLKAREINGAIVRPSTPYTVGQQVRLVGGSFDGLVADIIEMHERDRLTVLMDLLNQKVKTKLSAAQIAPT
jgi:transcriptional antiterminator RfaH